MPPLDDLVAAIVRTANPRRILLFSQKLHPDGSPAAVKLCVVIPDGDPQTMEHRLYMEIETDFPFDVLVYTAPQWERLTGTAYSLAQRAAQSGRILYEAE